jgi:hypothetical protein
MLTIPGHGTYVGFTRKSIKERARQHKIKSYHKEPVQPVHKAIRAAGHKFEIIELCSGPAAHLLKLEHAAIAAFGATLNVLATHKVEPTPEVVANSIKHKQALAAAAEARRGAGGRFQ